MPPSAENDQRAEPQFRATNPRYRFVVTQVSTLAFSLSLPENDAPSDLSPGAAKK